MLKFDRRFKAVFTIGHRNPDNPSEMIDEEIITVEYPFSVNFTIDTGTYSTSNTGQFQFYNLSPQDQAKLWLDLYESGKKYIKMQFYAGYQNFMPLIFDGFILESTSERAEGTTEWITKIQAFSAGNFFQYGFINATFTQGTTLEDILRYATEGTELKLGYITPDIPPLPMNKTFIGQTMDLLGREYGSYNIFVDNNELNIIGDNDVIPGDVEVIDDTTGLLGSPRRANMFLELDTIFAPNMRAAQAVNLRSKHPNFEKFNRAYKITTVKHQGIISPSVAGKLITTLTMTMFASAPNKLTKKAAETTYSATNASTKNVSWQRPYSGNFSITSPYNPNRRINGKSAPHYGMDIGLPMNTSVTAAADGKIIFCGWENPSNTKQGYGRYIKIDHGKDQDGNAVYSYYGHLNSFVMTKGTVAKGQIIAKSGNAGYSTGPHLHFEIRKVKGSKTQRINPTAYVNFA